MSKMFGQEWSIQDEQSVLDTLCEMFSVKLFS